jgi:hypothetical protein
MPCKCKSRSMPEEMAKDREIWIAKMKCKRCIQKDNCTVKDVRKCTSAVKF